MTRFFFAPEGPRRLALMRILLGLAMLWDMTGRWRYAVELYSSYGPPMPIFAARIPPPVDSPLTADAPTPVLPPLHGLHGPIPGPSLAVALHSGLLFFVFCVVIGWQTRSSLICAWLLFAWLAPLDLAGTFAKHSVIALHLLPLLACSHSDATWSVDAWRQRTKDRCLLGPAWPRRLVQVLVCAIYLGAVLTKLRSPAFFSGDLLRFSLLDDHWGSGQLGMWLSTLRHVPQLLSLGTLLIELLFPFLIWGPRTRLPMLAAAVALHAGMGLLLDLGTFSLTMFAALAAFLNEDDLDRCWRFPTRPLSSVTEPAIERANRSCGRSMTLYTGCALLFVAAGVGVQIERDWYGAFGRRSAAEVADFKEVPAPRFHEMLAQRLPAYEDYIHRIEIGSRVGSFQLFGSSTTFHPGDRIYVLLQFIRPRPTMKLEGLLIAPDGSEVVRFTHQVSPGYDYAIDGFELTNELPSGDYTILLQLEGIEFARRSFELAM